jgi:hypothetical protein
VIVGNDAADRVLATTARTASDAASAPREVAKT